MPIFSQRNAQNFAENKLKQIARDYFLSPSHIATVLGLSLPSPWKVCSISSIFPLHATIVRAPSVSCLKHLTPSLFFTLSATPGISVASLSLSFSEIHSGVALSSFDFSCVAVSPQHNRLCLQFITLISNLVVKGFKFHNVCNCGFSSNM